MRSDRPAPRSCTGCGPEVRRAPPPAPSISFPVRLSRAGTESSFELEWAGTYEEGKERLAKGEHDVYLVDYHLDAGSGIELVRGARALQNRAPIILLTGKGRYEVDVEAMEAGVSDYLEKSNVNPDTLERSIRYAMERVRAESALRETYDQVAKQY